ncbi:MAG: hypothetical protein HUU26_14870 [Gemmatimonadaceae bacterium]|nr:hypothetical protein [Gemmatimonadaceae bacterium]
MSNVRAIVAGHGTFAEGMLSAIEQITGRSDLFIGVSNRDLSAQDVERLLRERQAASGATVISTVTVSPTAGVGRRLARIMERDCRAVSFFSSASVHFTAGLSLAARRRFSSSRASSRDLLASSTVSGRS